MSATQQTLAQLVKSKYPGSYDDMDDATLESSVLAKHPEYSDLPRTQSAAPKPNLVTGQGMEAQAQQQAKQVLTGTGLQGNYDKMGRKVSGPNGQPLTYMEKAGQAQGDQQTVLGAAQNRAARSPTPFTNAAMAYSPASSARAIAGSTVGSKVGGAIAPKLSNSPEAEQYGQLIGGTLGGTAASLPWSSAATSDATAMPKPSGLGNKTAGVLRNPATARQSQMGRPGTVKDFLPPQAQKWGVPPWLIPKGDVGTPTNPGPFMEIPARMPKAAPVEAAPAELGSPENPGWMSKIPNKMPKQAPTPFAGAESEEGVPGTLPKPSGRIVKLPQEFSAEDQLQGIAKTRASQRGMQFAAGMVPTEGRSVPWTPTKTNTVEFSPRVNPTPSLKMETDSLGIRWAVSPEGYRVSIPKSVPDEAAETYAGPKLAEQAQLHSLPWMKRSQQ